MKKPFGLQRHTQSRLTLVSIILVVQLLAVMLYVTLNQSVTEDAKVAQMTEMLERAERGALRQIESYVNEVNRASETVVRQVADDGLSTSEYEEALFRALEYVPHMAGAFVGDHTGAFVYVFRDGDTFGTKEIVPEGDGQVREVKLTDRSESFEITATRTDPSDEYDPRKRPWYALGLATENELAWTKTYLFFTSKQPGVTLAASVGTDDAPRVVGVDVELSAIVSLLKELSAQTSGEVFLHDRGGDALTRFGLLKAEDTPSLDDIDPADTAAVERVLSDQRVRASMAVMASSDVTMEWDAGGVKHLGRERPVPFGSDWVIGFDITEEEVVAPVLGAMSRQRILAMIVGTIAGLLMALLFIPATRPIKRLEIDSRTDELTSLPNRREIIRRADSLVQRGEALSVAMLDLDRFKLVNDTFGHAVGDEVLKAVTRQLHASGAEVGRMGGEEFVMLLRSGDCLGDERFLSRLVRRVASNSVETSRGPVGVTFSAGISACRPGESFASALSRADRALMQAKTQGRNRVVADWESSLIEAPTSAVTEEVPAQPEALTL